MNTTQLDCFLAVAQTLSFARAAERLHLSQPSVTHQIKSLEAELGCALFVRTTRRVSLTEQGWQLLPDAEALLSGMLRVTERFRSPIAAPRTRLAVGCGGLSFTFGLAKAFARLRETHEGLSPDTVVMPTGHLHQMLADGELDVILDMKGTVNPAETFTELGQTRIVCACSRECDFAGRDSVTLAELAGRRFAAIKMHREGEALRTVTQQLLQTGAAGEHHFVESIESAAIVAAAGFALTVQPEQALPPIEGLVRIPIADLDPLAYGAYTLGASNNPVVAELIGLLRE